MMEQKYHPIICIAIALFTATSIFGQQTTDSNTTKQDSLVIVPDDPILEALDKLISSPYFEANKPSTDPEELNIYGFSPNYVPAYNDSIYKKRLERLDEQTPFDLIHNEHVQRWINLYATKKRKLTSKLLGLSYTYYPLFEEVLDRYDLPLEFKHLAIVESALNPTARSRSGAVGLWQFMYRTGKIYDLNANSYIDERRDIYLSTVAACEYFSFLYKIFNDWDLVLASYNAGPGTITRAIRRADGETDYWKLWPFLPRETRGYVPAFIAVNYVMNHPAEHNIYPKYPKITFFEFDTVHVNESVTFAQISAVLDIPIEDLEYLNPTYKRHVIPLSNEPKNLCLPKDKVGLFIKNEETVYNYNEEPENTSANNLVTKEMRKTHIVRKGQYLGSIANRYGVSVNDIKDWNGLRSTRIHPGQRLTVHVTVKEPKDLNIANTSPKPKSQQTQKTIASNGKFVYYTIQKGDTLWDIARNRGTTVGKLKLMNSNLNHRHLKPGSKIIASTQS